MNAFSYFFHSIASVLNATDTQSLFLALSKHRCLLLFDYDASAYIDQELLDGGVTCVIPLTTFSSFVSSLASILQTSILHHRQLQKQKYFVILGETVVVGSFNGENERER